MLRLMGNPALARRCNTVWPRFMLHILFLYVL